MKKSNTMPDITKRLGILEAMCREECDFRMATDIESAIAEILRLHRALQAAIEFAEEGWGYVSPYFCEKWGYDGQLATLKATLEGKG
jgi:hypothetical protein